MSAASGHLKAIWNWFRRDRGVGSSCLARERLRLVLVHDRTNTSPGVLEMLREDLIEVISTYMDIDRPAMEMSLSRNGDSVVVIASIPILGVKRQLPGAS
ncbi:MAG TPA: cell division topological specificity factor MinE [Bacillota bacterium]|nr:cell division topological specificity factor MinE [Bacillota bacterium]